MNKVFLGLVLAVCALGMALVMLNDRLGRKPETRPAPPVAEMPSSPPARSPAEIAAAAQALEIASQVKNSEEAPEITEVPQAAPEAVSPPPAPMPEPARPAIEDAPKPALAEKTQVAPVRQPEPIVAPTPKPEPAKPAKVEKPEPVKPVKAEKPETAPKPAETASGASKTANRFVVYSRDNGATVRIGGTSKMTYSSMTLEDPDRVVVDLQGDWKFPANPGIPKNDLVKAVRVGKNGDKTRLVIDLKEKPRRVNLVPLKDGQGVDVRVDK